MGATASIIICTCNRAEHLRQTLASIGQVCVPAGMDVELLVVDNASTDSTASLVQNTSLPNMPLRYVLEPRRGQCYARNIGMAHAHGDVILFTDDDVRPPQDWITGMCAPILAGDAHAVAGSINMAPHLEREWMQPLHHGYLANVECVPGKHSWMVGANMAFAKAVLDKVPAFDTALGPGASGFADDTLFSFQVDAAGYKTASVSVSVEHHFNASRLTRQAFLNDAAKRGRSGAYFSYHWLHDQITFPLLREWKYFFELMFWRVIKRRDCQYKEGAPVWELELIDEFHFFRQYRKECRTPRNYERHGLVKRLDAVTKK